jgi:UDP-N-acetylmuramate dehydrogenase
MMIHQKFLKKFPFSAGQYQTDASLASSNWFHVGGPADLVFKPSGIQGLILFLKERPEDIPYTLLGVGSNVLIRDGGIRGIVIRLTQGFRTFFVDGSEVEVGAGLLDRTVAENCCMAGIGGLEFLATIPGTIGGALRMNAGAFGQEIKDCLVYAMVIDPKGNLHRLTPSDLGYGYRHCSLPQDMIFLGARLRGKSESPCVIRARMDDFFERRAQTQPTSGHTGGSTFANPDDQKAWALIDQAGCRGLRKGGAVVSLKHCNFIINDQNALARDIEDLGEEVRKRVYANTGVVLRWEIMRLGDPRPDQEPVECLNPF